jgi:hypothetical protein
VPCPVIGSPRARLGNAIQVNYANTSDEAVGDFGNVVLTEDDRHYQHSNTSVRQSLVIDIGATTEPRSLSKLRGPPQWSDSRIASGA